MLSNVVGAAIITVGADGTANVAIIVGGIAACGVARTLASA
jgi:hypothetical protein